MGKKSLERQLSHNEALAVVRNLRVSPQKLNLVAAMVRGKKCSTALIDLSFSKKRIAEDVKKGLQSAMANATENHSLDLDKLYIKEASVGKSIVMKRFHVRGRGKGTKIMKPFSNLRLVVEERKE